MTILHQETIRKTDNRESRFQLHEHGHGAHQIGHISAFSFEVELLKTLMCRASRTHHSNSFHLTDLGCLTRYQWIEFVPVLRTIISKMFFYDF